MISRIHLENPMARKLFLLLVVLFIMLFSVSLALAAKSYRAERFDVQIGTLKAIDF